MGNHQVNDANEVFGKPLHFAASVHVMEVPLSIAAELAFETGGDAPGERVDGEHAGRHVGGANQGVIDWDFRAEEHQEWIGRVVSGNGVGTFEGGWGGLGDRAVVLQGGLEEIVDAIVEGSGGDEGRSRAVCFGESGLVFIGVESPIRVLIIEGRIAHEEKRLLVGLRLEEARVREPVEQVEAAFFAVVWTNIRGPRGASIFGSGD